MKKILVILAIMMVTAFGAEGHNHSNPYASVSVQTFYDDLLPYGDWINTPDYGYAWRPFFGSQQDFKPYSTRGNWVYTDAGWTWVSDYRWGWATFHYGRWYFDDRLGWMWIPGVEWAPAWVTWGSYDDLWAWAPMGPDNHVTIQPDWYAPRFWWTFVPRHHFCSPDWHSFIVNRPVQVTRITCISNIYYQKHSSHYNGHWFHGPGVRDVERHLNKKVRRMQSDDFARRPVQVNHRTADIGQKLTGPPRETVSRTTRTGQQTRGVHADRNTRTKQDERNQKMSRH